MRYISFLLFQADRAAPSGQVEIGKRAKIGAKRESPRAGDPCQQDSPLGLQLQDKGERESPRAGDNHQQDTPLELKLQGEGE